MDYSFSYYKFALDGMNAFHCGFEFYRTHVAMCQLVPRHGKVVQVSFSHCIWYYIKHLILNKCDMMIMIIGSLIGRQYMYNRSSDDSKVSGKSV